jgi:hypothetical protein
MKASKLVTLLAVAVAILGVIYAGAGLFMKGGSGPFPFTSVHGQQVEIYGQGLYYYDSTFKAPILRGTDAVTLFICVPALLAALFLSLRGSLSGGLMLTSMFTYFLYNSASLAFGAAYNRMMPAYILSFSASFFGMALAIRNIYLPGIAARTSDTLPRRWIAAFLFLAGMSLLVWVADIIGTAISGGVPPRLGPYSTEPTYALDLGIILPAAWAAAVLVLRRDPLGTLLACMLITLNLTIGLAVASQSIMQVLDGIILTPGEYAAYAAPFILLSLIAAWLLVTIYRNIRENQGPS